MTDETPKPTNCIELTKTSRRRALQGLAGVFAASTAGCLDSDDDDSDGDTNGSGPNQADSLPDEFESVNVGRYQLHVDLSNPDALQSVALTRATSGTVAKKQATDRTLKFELLGAFREYNPGEFALEARTDEDEVAATHSLSLEPKLAVTSVELLKNQDREKLVTDKEECASLPYQNIYTVENAGTGPAVFDEITAPLPDVVDSRRNRTIWPMCHHESDPSTEWSGRPIVGPGEALDFAPFGQMGPGFRSREPDETYEVELELREALTERTFTQTANAVFIDVGDGSRTMSYDIPADSEV